MATFPLNGYAFELSEPILIEVDCMLGVGLPDDFAVPSTYIISLPAAPPANVSVT